MLNNMYYVRNNLNYAKNSLSYALDNLYNFASINGTPIKKSSINNLKSKINNQLYNVNYRIIPAIKRM